MTRELLSFGSEFTAADRVANSPGFDVPARTTVAPAGGPVLEAA